MAININKKDVCMVILSGLTFSSIIFTTLVLFYPQILFHMPQNNDIATSSNNDYDNVVTTNDFLLQNVTVSNNDVLTINSANITAVTTVTTVDTTINKDCIANNDNNEFCVYNNTLNRYPRDNIINFNQDKPETYQKYINQLNPFKPCLKFYCNNTLSSMVCDTFQIASYSYPSNYVYCITSKNW